MHSILRSKIYLNICISNSSIKKLNKIQNIYYHKIDENYENHDNNNNNNNNNNNRNNEDETDSKLSSPSQPLEISGLVQGEPDDNQVQSQYNSGFKDADEGTRIQQVIDSGDMEQLAALVLNGEGKKLLNAKSSQPEIQAFLDNVQNYMDKIRRVHQAAKNGNLRELQAALDRRKFAIAKDEISPDGASPLHVATIFGHAAIIRYLGGRFPETTNTVDNNGRTPLHYAATINDNGHFYNLLTHLGGNVKAKDKFGYTTDFYKNQEESKNILSYKQLLKKFGVNEHFEDEMLNDQDIFRIENHQNLEIPLFRTEQGQYLANTLGDPLISGLTEIAERRPSNPVAYLANFLLNFNNSKSNKPQKQKTQVDQQLQQQQQQESPQINRRNSIPFPTTIENDQQMTFDDENFEPLSESIPLDPAPETEEPPPTAELPDTAESAGDDRDEHGQSMLHFASARAHSRNALYGLIDESKINITYRDELYRTARDVSLQASQPGNAKEIDRYVFSLAAKGEMKIFDDMVLEGYDHILDIVDDDGYSVIDIARSRGHHDLAKFLDDVHAFEVCAGRESREELHHAIREKDLDKIYEITALADSYRLIRAKNYYGRNAIHISVLKENEEIVEHLSNVCPVALKIGDNLERTPLHYAMGVNKVETLSRILIKKGAKRAVKDLKGRQPSYYFMNKTDILRLQEEEDEEH